MRRLLKFVEDFHRNERGATATEYVILLILVAVLLIAIVKTYGQTIYDKYRAADEVVEKKVTAD